VRLGIRAKLFILSLGLVTGSTLLVFAYARADLEAKTVHTIEQDLGTRLNLGVLEVQHALNNGTALTGLQPLAKDLAKASNTRVTIIRNDGTVVADSGVEDVEVEKLANHRLRPEVQQALSVGIGMSRRHSSTIEHDLLYVATPIGPAGYPSGVLRMALDLGAVEREVAHLQRGVGIGAVLALLLAVVTTSLAAVWASRATRQLTDAARRMSQGDLDTQIPQLDDDEFGELGRTLGQLARSLSGTLSELRLERDRMAGILTRMREGLLLLDSRQHIVLVNPALREMLLLQDDVVGKSVLEVIRHGELKKLLDGVQSKGEGASQEIEITGLKPRRLLVRVAPLGTTGAVFAVALDVTEMRRLESLRRDFVSNVSHELRTPVTAIRSAAETIRDVAVNDAQALPRFTDIIARNAERLGNLVDDLLDLSRIESREVRLVPEALDVSLVFAQVVELFRERADRRGQSLVSEVPPESPKVMADRRALEHILTNLIDNAVKYSGTSAVIRVQAAAIGSSVEIRVEDTGPGIADEHLPRLFERFYRVDTGRSRELGGTGLGLSIVKHMVEAMGSHIDVESTPGVGTRFVFKLPAASKSAG
jgi:two-component system, OmpR family, phosphate regulon sensor histidine kinase PhoR